MEMFAFTSFKFAIEALTGVRTGKIYWKNFDYRDECEEFSVNVFNSFLHIRINDI